MLREHAGAERERDLEDGAARGAGRVRTAKSPAGATSRSVGTPGRSRTVSSPPGSWVMASHGSPSTRARARRSAATIWTSTRAGSTPGSLTTGSSGGLPTSPSAANEMTLTPAAVMTHAALSSGANTTSRGWAPTVMRWVTPAAMSSTDSSWSLPGPCCSGPSTSW
ncbi:hypothetical protein [Nannocystis pusilla]|uniref:hypothetical protein n=1 Tax=Nannocystis pusilla TaxID=889268 RepID=UPI003B7A08E3